MLDLRPQRTGLRLESVVLRPAEIDLRLDKSLFEGEINEQTGE